MKTARLGLSMHWDDELMIKSAPTCFGKHMVIFKWLTLNWTRGRLRPDEEDKGESTIGRSRLARLNEDNGTKKVH